LVTWSW